MAWTIGDSIAQVFSRHQPISTGRKSVSSNGVDDWLQEPKIGVATGGYMATKANLDKGLFGIFLINNT